MADEVVAEMSARAFKRDIADKTVLEYSLERLWRVNGT
jgi:hypothetical protein